MKLERVEVPGWPRPRGYNDGVAVPASARLLFVAGQIAWNERRELVGEGDFAAQFRRALENVIAVVRAAGGVPSGIASLTIFVADLAAYRASEKALGETWRELMGAHYPAIALVRADLLEPGALVEIQAVAGIEPHFTDAVVRALTAP